MRDSVAVIRDKAHEALTDLRSVLGVLRDDETGQPMSAPQPTYADVPVLVAECVAAGMYVTLRDDVPCDEPMPDAVGRTLYRIVQEALTNARKHAPGARVTVTVSGGPEDGVDVTVRNPLGFGPTAMPGAELGLVGLRERAVLSGGRLEHHTDHGVFELQAWIPWAS
jgi:signal transduction histidine kinase